MAKRYGREIKEEILGKVRSGQRVSEVARVHGLHEQTIRNWLERDTVSGAAETLEVSRLRRENESLLRIIGQLTYESDMQKKNQRRERR
jgi:transposase-like protein